MSLAMSSSETKERGWFRGKWLENRKVDVRAERPKVGLNSGGGGGLEFH
jgi:hypothetical protein